MPALFLEPIVMNDSESDRLGPLLLTWFNFNPGMDK